MQTKTKASAKRRATSQPPIRFQKFGGEYPALMRAYEALGFPSMVAALTWVEDVLNRKWSVTLLVP